MTHEARSGGGPGEGFLADMRRSHQGWVDCELQMLEDLPDHLALCHDGDDPQCAPRGHHGPCAISRAKTRFSSRAQLQRGDLVSVASSSTPYWRGVGMIAPRRWLCVARHPP